jgi:serine phosphatase RsbU (regulator of sigma subunit)
VLVTDGLIEAAGPLGEPYGEERLAAQVRRHSQDTAATLLRALESDLKNHCRKTTAKDDMTALVVKATAPERGASAA